MLGNPGLIKPARLYECRPLRSRAVYCWYVAAADVGARRCCGFAVAVSSGLLNWLVLVLGRKYGCAWVYDEHASVL
jgi:hypothetical protein